MIPNVRWIAAPQSSLLHAAAMLAARRPLIDAELAERIAPLVVETDQSLRRACVDAEHFWNSLVPWSANLATSPAPQIAEHLTAQLAAATDPPTTSELDLRSGPLRQAWEARGPGLWRALRQMLGAESSAEATTVILVRPALGGGGVALASAGCVSFEAVLANSHRELPEVVRLGWLIAQIQWLQKSVAPREFAVTLIPVLLAAAEEVELARCDIATLRAALSAWHIVDDATAIEPLAETIWTGWKSKIPSPLVRG